MNANLPLRVTAGVALGNSLSIVTLNWRSQHIRLVPTESVFFEMASDDQAGVRRLADELVQHFESKPVTEILVRRGPGVGPMPVSRASTKMETILQLMPFTCVHVHVQRVSNWAKSQDWRLPLPDSTISAPLKRLQEEAIKLAGYGMACLSTPQ